MPTSMLMPSLSPTMEEGVVAKWLVNEGDFIKAGTMLCSVETDKTTVDYESMDEGFLRKIFVPNGSPAKVNQLIAILTDTKDEDFAEFMAKAMMKSEGLVATKVGATTPAPAMASAPTSITNGSGPRAAVYAPSLSLPPQALPVTPAQGERVKASPLARKMAEDAGIKLVGLSGSGPMGRIVKRDIDNYEAPAQINTLAARSSGKSSDGPIQSPLYGSMAPIGQTQDLPLNMMRKTIGKRLLDSHQNIPNFYVTMKIEMDALNAVRNQLNRSSGYKISVNDLIIKATAFALRQHPMVNASFMGEAIRQNANIDICVAVSIEGGLITPIVRDADQKGLGHLSSEVKSLVAKAKAGKLAPEEFQGGTFTISNLGMYGVEEFTAIINPPQSAILAVGGIQTEIYLDGEKVKQKETMKVTLTSDHRVVDGALAAQFLSGLKSILENPVWLML